MQVKFYKCEICGNIAIKVVDEGPNLVCCGQPMTELVPDCVECATEKHIPSVNVEETHVHVNVGSVDHPMDPDHLIEFICLVKDAGYEIHPLVAGDAPSTDFYLGQGETAKEVYAYCNKHGLWKLDI